MEDRYNLLIQNNCNAYKLGFKLVKAIIATESNFNPWAVRFEPTYKWLYSVKELSEIVGCTKDTMKSMQMSSFGLMQIMGAVAYEIGLRTWATKLLDPDINIRYGCEYLRRLIESQNLVDVKDVYSAYNAGSVRLKENGEYVNHGNVDRFFVNYNLA